MTPLPGFAAQMPTDYGTLVRRIEAIERWQREALPSVSASFSSTVADITTLTSQVVVPASFYDHQTGFAVPNTYATKASVTLTVPDGFTQAIVSATAHVRILNNSGGDASYALAASIDGTAGPVITDTPADGQYGNAAVTYSTLLTGLTEGGTFTVATRCYSSPALTADAGNEATANGIVLWLR